MCMGSRTIVAQFQSDNKLQEPQFLEAIEKDKEIMV